MLDFKNLIDEIKNIKTDLMKSNEKQIVQLCFYMAKRLLMKEIDTDEEYIKTLLKKTLEMAQTDEEITIRVSTKDKVWLEQYKDTIFKELNLDEGTRIEEEKTIQPGGVVIETNFGVIDAQVEQRLEKLETILKDHS
jgi:flagellar biosynthesis/type III secretory pathway protein FliH